MLQNPIKFVILIQLATNKKICTKNTFSFKKSPNKFNQLFFQQISTNRPQSIAHKIRCNSCKPANRNQKQRRQCQLQIWQLEQDLRHDSEWIGTSVGRNQRRNSKFCKQSASKRLQHVPAKNEKSL